MLMEILVYKMIAASCEYEIPPPHTDHHHHISIFVGTSIDNHPNRLTPSIPPNTLTPNLNPVLTSTLKPRLNHPQTILKQDKQK